MKFLSILFIIRTFMLSIMLGIQHNGVFGAWSGQIGKSLVGLTIKGVNAIRTYVIPANPKSVAQIAQRDKFRLCSKIAEKELINICRAYWNHKSSKYAGFQAFVKNNVTRVTDGDSFGDVETTSGSYPGITAFETLTYNTATGLIAGSWADATPPNGDANDVMIALVIVVDEWDTATEQYVLKTYFTNDSKRSDGTFFSDITIETGIALTDIFVYIGVRNPVTADKIETGDSINANPAAV